MSKPRQYVLGLDLGVASLGWAVLELQGSGDNRHAVSIVDAGVRIFEAGVEGGIEQGKDSSRGAKRREARQPRRQQWRRQYRKRQLFTLLQRHGLLPKSDGSEPLQRKVTLDALDAELRDKHLAADDHLAQQKLPYVLRAKATEQRVEPHELGRALYHLAQRRGYLSNRKGEADDDEKQGKVDSGIKDAERAAGHQTLGQLFARDVNVFDYRVDPETKRPDPRTGRIRRRYLGRHQYRDEFRRIRDAQKSHQHLSDDAWNEIETRIFFQRPLKSQKHLIGRCSLEPKRRRCPEALPILQEFRILQAVNHLRARMPDIRERELTDEERTKLIAALQTAGEMSLKSTAKRSAGLPKGAQFTLEDWEDKLVGHRTNQKMISAFGDRWLTLADDQREQITLEVLCYRKPQALVRRAMDAWGLTREQAEKLAEVRLEEGYASLSKAALKKLVPIMRGGTPYATARKEAYPESFDAGQPLDLLPPVRDWNRDIKNPAVIRALTEVRKVVNAIVRKYGKPALIRVELARDLKNSRDRRKKLWQDNMDNRRRREKAAAAILEQLKNDRPSRNDIDKWLLADECHWECTYCGKPFGAGDLIGRHPQVDIEHIFPRLYLDNSFGNKTLACRACNHRKGNRLPKNAFSPEEHEAILRRVRRFDGPHRIKKLQRFQADAVPEDFVTRDLNDTRYNSRIASDYLGTLYGGKIDEHGRQRIFNPTGGLTALIRTAWGMNGILSDDNEKDRNDHRSHAIDAVVVALSDQALVQRLSNVAQEFEQKTDRERAFLAGFPDPWPGFIAQARDAIQRILVSHRPTRTLAGPLHAESIYSKRFGTEKEPEYRIRKELTKLTAKEIEGDQIVDPSIRALVQQKFAELGGGDPSKVFSDPLSHPFMTAKDGRHIPIHKVRLRVDTKPRKIGKGPRARNVASGKDSNYASMVYAVLDKDGKERKWVHEIVDRLTAHERLSANRKRAGEKILIPDEQDGKRRFKFSLTKNDLLLMEGPDGREELYRVQKLSQNEIQLCEHTRTIINNPDRTPWNRISSLDTLRKRGAKKVALTAIGEVVEDGGHAPLPIAGE